MTGPVAILEFEGVAFYCSKDGYVDDTQMSLRDLRAYERAILDVQAGISKPPIISLIVGGDDTR